MNIKRTWVVVGATIGVAGFAGAGIAMASDDVELRDPRHAPVVQVDHDSGNSPNAPGAGDSPGGKAAASADSPAAPAPQKAKAPAPAKVAASADSPAPAPVRVVASADSPAPAPVRPPAADSANSGASADSGD
ncbi:hypothetical protein [Actinophytocola sp. NPDC049390]|uniref:hypothetical protein n=1 Tax=Actinophytocola sp. NPDC049390 TaxID=3363894 RepID=UPI00378DC643